MTFLQATWATWSGQMTFVQFLDSKWGDVIALAILVTGIVLYKSNQALALILIGSGMTGLKLKSPLPGATTNGGKGTQT